MHNPKPRVADKTAFQRLKGERGGAPREAQLEGDGSAGQRNRLRRVLRLPQLLEFRVTLLRGDDTAPAPGFGNVGPEFALERVDETAPVRRVVFYLHETLREAKGQVKGGGVLEMLRAPVRHAQPDQAERGGVPLQEPLAHINEIRGEVVVAILGAPLPARFGDLRRGG